VLKIEAWSRKNDVTSLDLALLLWVEAREIQNFEATENGMKFLVLQRQPV
jgi:hypothetical protein